jgi:hypothetical protein
VEHADRQDGRVTAPAGAASPVFAALQRAGVRWCLWRGTPRLSRAGAGDGDFDLLVDRTQAPLLESVLAAAGCRRGRSCEPVPGLDDWFLLERPAGPLLHFHVHYRLPAGEPRFERFHLPFAAHALDSRECSGAGPMSGLVFVAGPRVEAALLLLRCSLRLRARDRLPPRRAARALLAKARGDLEALAPQGGLDAVAGLLQEWLGRPLPFLRAAGGRLANADLWRLRAAAHAALRPASAANGLPAVLQLWRRDLRAAARACARRMGLAVLPARGGRTGGAVVALVGEPAARRALAAAVQRVLGGKFDVLRLAAGAGWRRAQRARRRGFFVLAERGAEHRWPAAAAPDLELRLGDGQPFEVQLAAALCALWERV